MAIALVSPQVNVLGSTSVSSINYAAPGTMGSTHLDVVIFSARNVANNPTVSIADDGTAFTRDLTGIADTNGNQHSDLHLWRHPAANTPGTVAVSWTGGARLSVGVRLALLGVDLANPLDVKSASLAKGLAAANSGPFAATVPGITTTTDNAIVIACLSAGQPLVGIAPNNAPAVSGWTPIIGGCPLNATTSPIILAYYRIAGAAGPVPDLAVALTATGSNSNWVGAMAAYKADPSGGGVQLNKVNFFGFPL